MFGTPWTAWRPEAPPSQGWTEVVPNRQPSQASSRPTLAQPHLKDTELGAVSLALGVQRPGWANLSGWLVPKTASRGDGQIKISVTRHRQDENWQFLSCSHLWSIVVDLRVTNISRGEV